MKKIITSILALIALAAAYLMLQNFEEVRTQSKTITEIPVLVDITEAHISKPKPEEILALYGLDTNRWNGAEFRFTSITDVDYNKIEQASLPPAEKWFANEFEREKQVGQFTEAVKRIILDAEKDSMGRKNTSAYIPIARELNRLSKSKANRKILIAYSDLLENGMISLYGKEMLDSLENHPENLWLFFEKRMPLQQLNGIEVFLIYQPIDNQDSERFRMVSGFYQRMLESKGATVTIGANLIL